uniref:HSR domain-containing protein n=1 Tax=Loxodonta africana TaxID=9785 RepID=G3UCH4_LOXAF
RIFTKDQNTEEENTEDQFLYDLLFMLFKKNKVEIASAITKTFPFFMGLRDRGFLSEQMYENFLDTCANLVPVERVVYDVLTELEKTFDLPLLEVLFSKVNMKAYPDLIEVYQSFQDGLSEKLFGNTETQTQSGGARSRKAISCGLVAVQEDEGRESEETPRLLLPYDGEEKSSIEYPVEHSSTLTYLGTVINNPEAPQMTNEGELEEAPGLLPCEQEESKNVCLEKCDGEEPQKASISSPRNGSAVAWGFFPKHFEPISRGKGNEEMTVFPRSGSLSYDPETRQMTKEVPEEMPDLLPAEGEEGGNACLGMYDGEEPQGALGSPSRSELGKAGVGAELLALGVEKCSCVMCFSRRVPGAQEARTESSQASDIMGKV